MKSQRKGQIVSQIFVYMMAIIVVGAIAIIGYSSISKILGKSCDAEKAVFKSNLDELIEKYTSYGSLNKKTLKTPCEYESVCFVDSSMVGVGNINNGGFTCGNTIIESSVSSGADTNIFVKSNNKIVPIGYNAFVTRDDLNKGECLCINAKNGNFYITFTGKGASTEVSETK